MAFTSILFDQSPDAQPPLAAQPPAHFPDLFLDQIVAAVTVGREAYQLETFFYTPLHRQATILYRQAVMQDLGEEAALSAIRSFSGKMREVRKFLSHAGSLFEVHNEHGWFLDAADLYCEAVQELLEGLSACKVKSAGLAEVVVYLNGYIRSQEFLTLTGEINQVRTALSSIRYTLLIRENSVEVSKYEGEGDYSLEVVDVFAKFRHDDEEDIQSKLPLQAGLNRVEGKILNFVARLYPDAFASLTRFCEHHQGFRDETICRFDREIQFYLAYLEYTDRFKAAGLTFCFPEINRQNKEITCQEGFDLALGGSLLETGGQVVCNDFALREPERVMIVSGPNQGGKTTFARMYGQLHYLASLGLPVPGASAQVTLYDQLFTHFEKEESLATLHGKLQDDLLRIHDILEQATPHSIIILNEIFTSTTLEDAVFLSQVVMGKITELDLLAVCVTFIDELANLNEKMVSLVSIVDAADPAIRTYKILRHPPTGVAYALHIAEKYQVTYAALKERIQP